MNAAVQELQLRPRPPITRDELKGLVQRWRKRVKLRGQRVRSCEAYGRVAIAMGYRNWMVLSAMFDQGKVTMTRAQVAALFPGEPP